MITITDYKDIEVIRQEYSDGKYSVTTPNPSLKKVSEGHIFDEEKSVKWNREEVQRNNEAYYKQLHDVQTKANELFKQMREEVVKYIMGIEGVSREVAEAIEAFVYTEKHSYMYDYFSAIDGIMELVSKCIDYSKK